MKAFRTSIFILYAFTLTHYSYSQTILTADNNPGAVAVTGEIFIGATALQDAIAAASDNDIIHVVRSTNNYGTAVIDKPLNIFGIGLFPDTDGGVRSVMSQIDIPDAAASGTRISGMVVTTINLGAGTGTLNNILIENSQIRQIIHAANTTTLTNLLIRNCLLGQNLSEGVTITMLAGYVSNVVIANNVIYGNTNQVSYEGTNGSVSTDQSVIENNLFVHQRTGSFSYYAFHDLRNSLVKNNIFYRIRPHGKSILSQNSFENNISFDALNDSFLTSSGNTSTNNQAGVDPELVNVPNTNNVVSLSTFDPSLTSGSPAEGAGTDDTDLGVYGGPIPFRLEGTLIPTIQEFDVPSMVVEGDELKVHIKAKGN